MNGNLQNRIRTVLMNNNARTNANTSTGDGGGSSTSTGGKEYSQDMSSYSTSMAKMAAQQNDINSQNTKIFGLPHQFLPSTDIRIDNNNNFGYQFLTNIYSERPIVTLMPGKMLYLPDYSRSDAKIFGSIMAGGSFDSDNGKSVLESIISSHDEGQTRYYDFATDYSEYIKHVNLLCRVAAIYLGIGDLKGPTGEKYKNTDWGNYQAFNDYKNPVKDSFLFELKQAGTQFIQDFTIGQRSYVNFYIDPNSSVNESQSNTTQKSQLEGAFDSVEGIVKEGNMLLNSVSTAGDEIAGFFTTAGEAILDLANATTLGLFKNMLQLGGKEVLHGANMIFPEIWMESEYSKSFNIQINLSSPYGDTESIYLNIFVPMLHALALALPRQSSANSFSSPFLIRGYAQGWFSIDMGIVESISIDKGPEQSWNVSGLPTQVKITLQIKDLYSQLMLPPKTGMFFTNQGMMDYLGCMCGIDMTASQIVLKTKVLIALLKNDVIDIPNKIYRNIVDTGVNFFRNFFGY